MVRADLGPAAREDVDGVADRGLVELGASERPVDLPTRHDRHRVADATGRRAVDPHRLGRHRRRRGVTREPPRRRGGSLRLRGAVVSRRVNARRTAEELDRVREDRQHGLEALARARGTPRHVQDQRVTTSAGDGPRERRERRVLESGTAHQLDEARRLALDDRARGLGRHVPGSEPRPAGRHHQPNATLVRERSQERLDLLAFVRQDRALDDLEPGARRRIGLDRVAGSVRARALRDPVGHRDDGRRNAVRVHAPILPDVTVARPLADVRRVGPAPCRGVRFDRVGARGETTMDGMDRPAGGDARRGRADDRGDDGTARGGSRGRPSGGAEDHAARDVPDRFVRRASDERRGVS